MYTIFLTKNNTREKKRHSYSAFFIFCYVFLGEISIDDAHRHPLIRPAMQLIEMTLQNCQEYPVRKSLLIFK